MKALTVVEGLEILEYCQPQVVPGSPLLFAAIEAALLFLGRSIGVSVLSTSITTHSCSAAPSSCRLGRLKRPEAIRALQSSSSFRNEARQLNIDAAVPADAGHRSDLEGDTHGRISKRCTHTARSSATSARR